MSKTTAAEELTTINLHGAVISEIRFPHGTVARRGYKNEVLILKHPSINLHRLMEPTSDKISYGDFSLYADFEVNVAEAAKIDKLAYRLNQKIRVLQDQRNDLLLRIKSAMSSAGFVYPDRDNGFRKKEPDKIEYNIHMPSIPTDYLVDMSGQTYSITVDIPYETRQNMCECCSRGQKIIKLQNDLLKKAKAVLIETGAVPAKNKKDRGCCRAQNGMIVFQYPEME